MKHEYHWRLSYDGGETFINRNYASLDKALEDGRRFIEYGKCPDDKYPVAAELLLQDFDLTFSESEIWEFLEYNNGDRLEDGVSLWYALNATDAQKNKLAEMLNETVARWITENKIDTTANVPAHVRNVIEIRPLNMEEPAS